jgi:hypothetical protein
VKNYVTFHHHSYILHWSLEKVIDKTRTRTTNKDSTKDTISGLKRASRKPNVVFMNANLDKRLDKD